MVQMVLQTQQEGSWMEQRQKKYGRVDSTLALLENNDAYHALQRVDALVKQVLLARMSTTSQCC